MEFEEFKKTVDFDKIKERTHEKYGCGVSRDHFESMKCDMGSDVPTQNTTSDPWSGQQPYLKEVFAGAQDYYQGGGADLYGEPLTAERDPWSTQGEQSIFDYIYGDQFGAVGNAAGDATLDMVQNPYGGYQYGEQDSDPSQYGLTSPDSEAAMTRMLSGDPFQNPYTQQVSDAFTQDIMETYNRDIAPQNRTAQIAYQPGGSSRGDMINNRATDDLNENITNAKAGFWNDAYNRSLNDQQAGVGLGINQAGLGEQARANRAGEGINRYGAGVGGYGDLTNTVAGGYGLPVGIGETRQAQTQAEIDEQAFRFDYDQNQDYYNLQDYLGLIQGNYGGSQATSYDAGVSDLQRGISTGSGLLSMLASFG